MKVALDYFFVIPNCRILQFRVRNFSSIKNTYFGGFVCLFFFLILNLLNFLIEG